MNLITEQKILSIRSLSQNKNRSRYQIKWQCNLMRNQYVNSSAFDFDVSESGKYKRPWLNKNLY